MKVTCVMVTSANGKITQADASSIYQWTSPEDKHHFEAMVADFPVIVMGRETYEAAKKVIKPQPGKLRLVLTSNTDIYSSITIPEQLEFRSATPEEIVAEVSARGGDRILLAGGGNVNGQFFAAGLVDELYLTIEPSLFGSGKEIISPLVGAVSLQLLSVNQLNKKGTLLLHYRIEKG